MRAIDDQTEYDAMRERLFHALKESKEAANDLDWAHSEGCDELSPKEGACLLKLVARAKALGFEIEEFLADAEIELEDSK